MADSPQQGYPVVLTADRSLMASYDMLLEGMMSCSQTTSTPEMMMRLLIAPALKDPDVATHRAPLGMRRVEAALMAGDFSSDDVAIVTPDKLKAAIGPATKIIGVSSGDPLGIGMNSTTMAGLAGGASYPGEYFRRLMDTIAELRPGGASVVFGGAGAWQLSSDDDARRGFGVDHVFEGYCESTVAKAFRAIIDGNGLDTIVKCPTTDASDIPPITGTSCMGVVEVSRGCGMGCEFCTLGKLAMSHLDIPAIVADVETNVRGGMMSACVISEDLFRYGATGNELDPAALKAMLRAVGEVDGLGLIQADHVNVTSVARMSDGDLEEVGRLLAGNAGGGTAWVNLGVETASGRLLDDNGGGPKIRPFSADEWGDVTREQVRRLARLGFFPLVSLVAGLPGETDEDMRATIEWVRSIADERAGVFPLFHAPIDGSAAFTRESMGPLHWQLYDESYRINFRRIPDLYWRNQRAAGTPLWKRALLRALGRGQVVLWKRRFRCGARGI